MDMEKQIGINFARIRREKLLTQEKLAEITNLSQQYLSDMERGKRNPTIKTLQKIAEALDIEFIELLKPSE